MSLDNVAPVVALVTKDEALVELLRGAVRRANAEVAWLRDPVRGLRTMDLRRVVALVLDSEMHSGCVLQCAGYSKARNPKLKIVVLVSWWDERQGEYTRAADAFLHVPLRLEEVEPFLAGILAPRTAREKVPVG